MTWSVGLAALALLVVAGGAWFLGRPRAVYSFDDELLGDEAATAPRAGEDAFTAQLRATAWTRSTRCSTSSSPGSPTETPRSPASAARRTRTVTRVDRAAHPTSDRRRG